jgi:hypothetical protein
LVHEVSHFATETLYRAIVGAWMFFGTVLAIVDRRRRARDG